MDTWVKRPARELDERKKDLIVTIYGPYGPFKSRLKTIATALRRKGFLDTFTVIDRKKPDIEHDYTGAKSQKDRTDIELTDKSYYYVENSHVNVFIYYVKGYHDSQSFEIKHMTNFAKNKIKCSIAFMSESTKTTATLARGEMIKSNITRIRYVDNWPDKKIDNHIIRVLESKLEDFLFEKIDEID